MTKTALRTRSMAYTAMMVALMAICAWISIPTAAVSFTMQTFGVYVAAGLLGARRGTAAVAVYILLGAVGLPVFSNMTGGIGALAGIQAATSSVSSSSPPYPARSPAALRARQRPWLAC